MVRRLGLIVALLATLLPLSTLLPVFDAPVAASPLLDQGDDVSSSTLTNGNVRIAAGGGHTCALLDNGTINCWGYNQFGQLGNGNNNNTSTPTNIDQPNGLTATAITTGGSHTCALLSDGTISCWGNNQNGQLGNGNNNSTNTPTNIGRANGLTATAITAGALHTCALLDNGTISCWGNNQNGQLGNGNNNNTNTPTNIDQPNGLTAIAITAGALHTCALLSDGTISCWGYNPNVNIDNANTPTIIDLPNGHTATAITSGQFHTCALLDNSQITCWGSNLSGQLGNGSNESTYTPGNTIDLGAGRTATAITSGTLHTCALLSDGTISCWGNNQNGQLGNGNNNNTNTPTNIGQPNGLTATAITAGALHTCALLSDGTITCWGNNQYGQLGNGNTSNANIPYQSPTLTDLTISQFANASPYKIRFSTDQAIYDVETSDFVLTGTANECAVGLPFNSFPKGTVTFDVSCDTPGTIALSLKAYSVRTETNIWGPTEPLIFRSGTTSKYPVITDVTTSQPDGAYPYYVQFKTNVNIDSFPENFVTVPEPNRFCYSTPDRQSAVIGQLITVKIDCFNSGVITPTISQNVLTSTDGNTGPATTFSFPSHTIRSQVPIITNTTPTTATQNPLILRFASSADYTNLVSTDFSYTGTATKCTFTPASSTASRGVSNIVVVRCANPGTITPTLKQNSIFAKYQSGPATNFSFGTFTISSTTGPKVLDVSAGLGHTCAILTDHSLKCWGGNEYGQLGYGDTVLRSVPSDLTIDLGTERFAVEVRAAREKTCALLDDGSMKCWGRNTFSQLGDGTYQDRLSPNVEPINFGKDEKISSFNVGDFHGCAVTFAGVVRCWGLNDYGQFGTGDTDWSRSPTTKTVDLGVGRIAKTIQVGDLFTCAILDNNTSKCWGYGRHGQLGVVADKLLTPPSEPINYGLDASGERLWPKSISANGWNVCAILNDNSVKCSGWNRYYQLGDGSPTMTSDYGDVVKTMTTALNLGVGESAQQISVGAEHVCVLLMSSKIKCWGDGFFNIGYESRNKFSSPPSIPISLGTTSNSIVLTANKVSAGFHSCAILMDSTLKCWGYNTRGEVGIIPTVNSWDTRNIGDAPGEMGSNLPRVGVRQLSVMNSTPSGNPLSNPFDLNISTEGSFSSLESKDFSYSGTAKNCSFSPLTSSATGASNVTVRVRCASAGTFAAKLINNSVQDTFGISAPSNDIVFASVNVPIPTQLVTNTSNFLPTSRRFAIRLRFSEAVTGIAASDFVNTATANAATCSFTPSSSTATAGIDIILSATCTTDGDLNVALNANSVLAVGAIAIPPTTQDLLNTTINSTLPIEQTQLALGVDFSCALAANGTVKCWGENGDGQLGIGHNTNTNTPSSTVSFATGRIASVVAAGGWHACAILDNGTVTCWGNNENGQLGNGNNNHTNTPTSTINFGNGRTATAITAGGYHTCALLDNGTVTCWGNNENGQLGNGNNNHTNTPTSTINFGNGRTATAITAGGYHTCALLDNGTVTCWGNNENGQLGNGNNNHTNTPGAAVNLGDARTATAITAGFEHTCVILDNDETKCWGKNNYGQLGNGNNNDTNVPGTAINFGLERTTVSIIAGLVNTCAILDNDETKCWGLNIGGNSNTYVATPSSDINFGDGRSAISVSVGNGHICALLDDSNVKCWGYNLSGQLGIGTSTNAMTPSGIVNFDRAKLVETTASQGASASPYILRFTTDVAIYGLTPSDFTFSGSATGCSVSLAFDSYPAGEVSVPVTCETEGTIVVALRSFTVSDLYGRRSAPTADLNFASHTYNTRALTVTNTTGLLSTKEALVVRFSASKSFTDLDASDFSYTGTASDCTITPSTASAAKGISVIVLIRCLTAGTVIPTLASSSLIDPLGLAGPVAPLTFGTFNYEPLATSTFMKPIAIKAGKNYSCATLQNGKVTCWGNNTDGQHGNGNDDSGNSSSTPVTFSTLVSAVSVTAGDAHTCALTNVGAVTCWGNNADGQLGNGNNNSTNTPTIITLPGGHTATAITTGYHHTCALLNNGQITCWGWNLWGQLGNGTRDNTDSPGATITLPIGRTATAITAGYRHTCALLDNGTITCWGYNQNGELGNGNTDNINSPGSAVNLGNARTATAITTSTQHTCALLDNGTIKCWGDNQYGQLGNGTRVNANTPTTIALPDDDIAIAVTTGYNHTCALLDNGTITCWGDNQYGELGNGNNNNTNTPGAAVNLGNARTATAITTGYNHTCALLDNGTIKCWGYNGTGQLGLGDNANRGSKALDMGDNLPYVPVTRLISFSSTTFASTETTPFTFNVKFNGDFTGLDSQDFSYTGTAGDCRFSPASPSGYTDITVDVTVRCATGGTFTPILKSLSVYDTTGVAGPASSMILSSTNVAIGTGFVTDTTPTKPTTLDFILRTKFDSNINGLTSSDFSNAYTGAGAATGCTFTPASSSIAAGLDAIIRAHCEGAGVVEPVLAAGAVIDSVSLSGPPIPLSFGTHFLSQNATNSVVSIARGSKSSCAVFNDGRAKCWGDNTDGQLGYSDTISRGLQASEMGTRLGFINVGTERRIVQIAAADSMVNDNFACALLDNGSITCWGAFFAGQVLLDQGKTAVAISAGEAHICALLHDGDITCWGKNTFGQLGLGDTTWRNNPDEPVDLGLARTAISVEASGRSTCAILDNQSLKCWGNNESGQLGLGDNLNRGDEPNEMGDNLPAINLGPSRYVTSVSGSIFHTCASLDDGTVKCWGSNFQGLLGRGDTTTSRNLPGEPVDLGAGFQVSSVAISGRQSCVISQENDIKCWSQNSYGQLGAGDTSVRGDEPGEMGDNLLAINIGTGKSVKSLGVGAGFICALLTDSSIKCWGRNLEGQLGLGDTQTRGDGPNEMGDNLPTVNLLAPSVTAGSILNHSNEVRFSLTFSDDIFGLSSEDFTYSGTATDCTFTPWSAKAIAGLPVLVIANCATSGSVDITLNQDSVFDINGNAGPYSSYEFASTEIDVTEPTATFVNTQTSDEDLFTSFALRLKFDEAISGLTSDDFKYTGSAQGCQFSTPVSDVAPEVETFVFIRCETGGNFQVTLKARSVIDKSGNSGPINDLQFSSVTLDPYVMRIPIQIDGGDDHTCALFNDGRVKCWGTHRNGELGVGLVNELERGLTPGSMGDNATFINFGNDSFVVSITSGKDFNCALLSNGRPKCWGDDSFKQLGQYTRDYFVPNVVRLRLVVTQISAGDHHACALDALGAITCWGANYFGQLGIGSTEGSEYFDYQNALNFGAGVTATQVFTGSNHTCAILFGGDVSCWGDNANGQLGFDPTTAPVLSSPSTFLDFQNNRSALSISAGGNHTCAILNDDTLSCWGANNSGQIGNGDSGTDVITPTDVAFDNSLHATFVAAGGEFTCAILSDSSSRCWGANGSGQLGHGDSLNTDTPGSALDFAGTRKANVLGTGTAHSCAVLDDLTTKCWGNNSSGELGLESSAGRGTNPNDLNGIVTDVRLFDRVVATDHSNLSSGIVNPVILTFAFDKAIHNLEWSDLSFVPDPNPQSPTYATGCSAGILVTSAEENEDIDLYVMCNTSGEVHLQLDAYSVTDLNGYSGPESRFLFPVFTIDASRPVITPSAYPTVIGSSGSFRFTSNKWFEGLGENDFTNEAQTNAASGCVFSTAPEVTGAIAGDTVEVFVSCETEGNLIPRMMPGSIFDKAGNPGPLMGQVFPSMIVDLTAPAASIMMPNPAPSAYPFSFSTTFSERVSGITGSDFVNSGTASGCVFTPVASSANSGVALSVSVTCASSGTIAPRLVGSSVTDEASNSGPVAQVDGTPITITVIPPPPINIRALSALTPARILNTRAGVGVRAGRVVNQSVELQVTGAGGVPSSGVSSVSMNVTVTDTTAGDAGGYVTVYPCGALPDASNLNFVAGQTIPNAVITPVSASGKVCFYVYGGAHLIADVNGWSAPGSGFTPVNPSRVLNTRSGNRVVNSTTELQVTGVGSIPSTGVGAVSLNVTVTTTSASDAGGYVTVYPCGTLPDASNLNFVAGQTIPNAVITPVSASGKVCFYVYGGAHLIADINGWYATGNGFVGVTPSRVLNTRGGNRVIGTTKELQVTGVGSIPSIGIGAVSLNVTVTDTTADDFGGYVTVYPCGTRPEASNLNFVAGQTIPNAVITPVSDSGKVCFYVFGGAHLIADINGYYTS